MYKKIHTKFYIAIGGIVLLLIVLLFMMQHGYVRHIEESPLYKLETAYRIEHELWEVPQEMADAEGSAELLFLQGMKQFDAKAYAEAEALFRQALTAEGKDPALPTYLPYYINQCIQMQKGEGEFALVSEAMAEAAKYSPLANDEELFWNLVRSVSFSYEADHQMVGLLEAYLENTKNLDLRMVAWLENCIGMLQYNNKEYANAIRNFYDVELLLQEVDLTATSVSSQATEMEIALAGELRYAKEYIANIYYIFEDYEQAAALYWELAETASGDEIFHEYGACINMASACLDNHDTEGARKAVALLEEVMPKVAAEDREEVEAHKKDVLANIYIKEGDYAQAKACLEDAEAYYQEKEDKIFLGGKHFVRLSRCKYWASIGNLMQAQTVLEEMNASGITKYYGLEKEVYKLLEEIFRKTGQTQKLIEVYQLLQEYDEAFTQTMQQGYLEFSKYYRENNELKEYNGRLSRMNMLGSIIIVIIICIVLLLLLLMRLLNTKNITDQLTGVYNRKKLNRLLRQYQKAGTPANLGVAMMDIDYFKRYNDTYGHPAGDAVLKAVAEVLKTSVRKKDTIIRYGGEEFLLLLSEVSAENVEMVCERIRKNLTERAILHEKSLAADHITLSIGVCHQKEYNSAALERMIEEADACLYHSKETGRNRVTLKRLEGGDGNV